jgi:hypothetical protein
MVTNTTRTMQFVDSERDNDAVELFFRPHPNPLPEERESRRADLQPSLNGECSGRGLTGLPLLGGEGRGEGGPFFPVNSRGLESAISHWIGGAKPAAILPVLTMVLRP